MKEKKENISNKFSKKNFQLDSALFKELIKSQSCKTLFNPADISSIVFFRILFGIIMFIETFRYLNHNWITQYWTNPQYHFTYWPFDFLKPLPENGMYILFYFMAFLAVCIITGFLYRISMILFFICFSYIFLLEQTRYMNHFYLIILISFVMIFIPANSSVSLDSKLFKKNHSETIPVWTIWLMRFMIAVPYFFGGIAKINTDWLQGQPLKLWLSNKTDFPVIGNLFQYNWMVLFIAYSGLFLDLLIVPLLLFKKTRNFSFIIIILFHLMNAQLFRIGIFPWFMIAATSLFFNPDWFRKIINFIMPNKWELTSKAQLIQSETSLNNKEKTIVVLLILWISFQVLLPLRHLFIPGNVNWTEEGHRYSWHMKLRTKNNFGIYKVMDKKTGITQIIEPLNYLTKQQYNKMGDKPYLVWQFCQIIKNDFKEKGMDVAVYANVKATLNGRKYQQLIDSTVDLTAVPRPFFPAKWVIPLETSLNNQLSEETKVNNGVE